MTYEDYCGEDLVLHVEECESCQYLEAHGHWPDCEACDHPWHAHACGVDRGDMWDEQYKGECIALGPCPCDEVVRLTTEEIEEAQARCAAEEAQATLEAAMDLKYQTYKDREL